MGKNFLCRIFSLLFCGILLLNSIPAAFAESDIDLQEQNMKESAEIRVTPKQVVPDVELLDSAELFAAFVEQKLYGYDTSMLGVSAREKLNTAEQGLYDSLKEKIEAIAANGGSTSFVLSDVTGLKTTWTNADLGVSHIEDIMPIIAAFESQFNLDKLIDALLIDCPFDLYWYDKTQGMWYGYGFETEVIMKDGQPMGEAIRITDLTFQFVVSPDYSVGEFTVTTEVGKITTAKNNAAQVVANNATKSDYEKMVAYKDYICAAVSYDDDAVSDITTPYGNPWQLIHVFDGNSSTNVVCEGYSKAFMYLCDLTTFTGDVTCYTVSGDMFGGAHMWNIVTLEEKNYMVDVTNSDSGTIGQTGFLFLAGAAGSAESGYTFNGIPYTYDTHDKSMWGTDAASILTLASENYTPGQNAGEVTHTVTFKVGNSNVSTQTVKDGKTVTAPDDPSQSGKIFLGWYTDSGTKFNFSTPITGDLNLTAKFEDVRFDLAGANMLMGNDLSIFFYVQKADLGSSTDYYAQITKTYADGTPDTVSVIPYENWESYNSTLIRFSYNGIAAKEMADDIYVVIYDGDGNTVSNVWEDSIRTYATRALKSYKDNAYLRTLMVDMLNYGAVAQGIFSYNTGDLANKNLTAEQAGWATSSVTVTDKRVKGSHYYGSTLSLTDKILMTFYFDSITPEMRAEISYTDHYGNAKVVNVPGSDFYRRSNNLYGIDVKTLVVADGRRLVTVNVFDSRGNLVASASDSVESYVARIKTADPSYVDAMKFVDSAYAYLHS